MRHRSRGQVVVWVAILVPALFLPIVGLAIDAGVVFDARRDLQNVADSAARTAGMMIDENVLRTGRGDVQIDVRAARQEASRFLTEQIGIPEDQFDTSRTTTDFAVVTVWREVRPNFMRIFRFPPVRIIATGRAQPCSGLTSALPVSCTT